MTTDRNPTILIVDDSKVIQSVINDILTTQFPQLKVIAVHDANKAVQVLKTQAIRFVYLDIILVGIDGINLLQLMALNPELKRPTLLMSGNPDNFKTVRQRVPGDWYDFISKPFDKGSLIRMSRKVIQQFQARQFALPRVHCT